MFKVVMLMLTLSFVTGCQLAAKRNQRLVHDRAEKLKPLSSWTPTWCQLDAELTQPAKARYERLFPDTESIGSLSYTWKAQESSCELTSLSDSKVAANHKGFLQVAMCTLLHVYWVNSPFDELAVSPEAIQSEKDQVHIRALEGSDLGLYLAHDKFEIETRTKGAGVLRASYVSQEGQWLPSVLRQRLSGGTVIQVDEIEWGDEHIAGRRMPQSMWVSVGTGDQALRHSKIHFSGCRAW